jgi:hypothetical protein
MEQECNIQLLFSVVIIRIRIMCYKIILMFFRLEEKEGFNNIL